MAAEDTRTARVLLNHFEIKGKRLISYNEHNRSARIPQLLDLLSEHDTALVCDAGTPAISDPGSELVAAARDAGYKVVPVPGASSVVAAASVAGLTGAAGFCFQGFLPRASGQLRRLLEARAGNPEALVAFEAPSRLRKTLSVLDAVLPARRLAVCRELTKLHEEVFVGTAAEALLHFEAPRGEIVIVMEGSPAGDSAATDDGAELALTVGEMRRLGLTRAQATALLVSRFKTSRRQAYELWLSASREGN